MQCVNHPAEAATAICTRCDKLLCATCVRDHKGKNFCAGCAEYLGQRAQQRQQVAGPSVPEPGPGGDLPQVYDGPPPADVYQGPPPVAQPLSAPAAPSRPATVNPYESPAPSAAPRPPAASPYERPVPTTPPLAPAVPPLAPAAPPQAPAAPSRPPAANPYQSQAPTAPAPPIANPAQTPAAPPPLPPSGDVYQGPPPGDVYQGPPPADAYQGPPSGDVYQGPPPGDVYQGPPADGTYQGPPTAGTYQGPKEGGMTLPMPESEGSTGRAMAFAAGFGLLAVLVWYGFSESTSGQMKAPLIGSFLGLVIGHSAVRGAGRGGGDVATLSVGVTTAGLVLGEVLIGYQPERMYISMGFWEWILYLISLYEGWNVPASRA